MDNEKLNILKLLIENKDLKFSIRQIARQRNINYKSAYSNLLKLEKENVVDLERYGNTTLCSFNNRFNNSVFQVEYYRKNELLKNKTFAVLHKSLFEINSQFILLLFGSYVKGKETKNSDIDLLLISNNPKDVETQIGLLPLNIHLTDIDYKDFVLMLESKKFSVVSEAFQKNIILFGIEDYYRLVEKCLTPKESKKQNRMLGIT